ncbi:hypothetical protein BOTBODRAFT_107157 [Botryobasidium botryosum FD-172 SS1]|uniref:PBP domain-containing protein n=1 Tax=Botryobasidium botryosum (strain FD-172 SS1) TaxID=930990 RepID=A0A067MXM1_BOTB1|nr:hypothetical protein BOTBODRAFT_107157 [Botryobasidium botryosum FD-172 SS1]
MAEVRIPIGTKVPVVREVEPHVYKVAPAKTYTGKKYNKGTEDQVRLRISNGGAGQSGLIEALASAYIDWSREYGGVKEDYRIAWITGDTTESIKYLESGDADIAITYNAAAEKRTIALKIAASPSVYGFRDHFYLVGPLNNPAKLTDNDSVHDMLNKIVTTGDAANTDPPTRFLSRFDKSATNIKESLLFAEIGQTPWSYAYSKWYHQYPQYPVPSLKAASLLKEYTLTDRGTYLTVQAEDKSITDNVKVYKRGGDTDPNDPLLNPATVLLGTKVDSKNQELAQGFMTWIADKGPNGGQEVIKGFKKPGTTEYLYTAAP